jgi:GGDEF domain-containing protein
MLPNLTGLFAPPKQDTTTPAATPVAPTGYFAGPQQQAPVPAPATPQVQVDSTGTLPRALPYMAIGWTPKGEPYYGDGLVGWARKTASQFLDPTALFGSDLTPDPKDPTKQIPILQKAGVNLPSTPLRNGEILTPEQQKTQDQGNLGGLGKTLQSWPDLLKEDPGKIIPADMGILGGTLQVAGAVMGLPAQGIRRIFSAGFALKDLPALQQMFPKMTFSQANSIYQSGDQMVYTGAFSAAARYEYVREVMSGVPPAFAVEKNVNPWIDGAFGILIDPMWLVGGNASEGSKAISAADDFTKVNSSILTKVVNETGHLNDEMLVGDGLQKTADAVKTIFKPEEAPVAQTALQKVGHFLFGNIDDKTIFQKMIEPVATAKANIFSTRVNEVGKILQGAYKDNPEEIGRVISSILTYGKGTDEEIAAHALPLLQDKVGQVLFSRAGEDFQRTIVKIAGDDPAAFIDKITELGSKGDGGEELTKFVADKFQKVADELYPSVNDLQKASEAVKAGSSSPNLVKMADQFDKLNPIVKRFNAVNDFLLHDVFFGKGWADLNSFFSGIYMGLSPAYAMRNAVQNSVAIFADQGIVTGAKSIGIGLEETLRGMVGAKEGSLFAKQLAKTEELFGGSLEGTRALAGLGMADQNVAEGTSLVKKIATIGTRAGQEGEKGASLAVWGDVFEKEMYNAARHGGIPDMSPLVDAGMPKQMTDDLYNIIMRNHLDITKSLKIFREASASGSIESWRYMDINPALKDFLSNATVNEWKTFSDLMLNSKTADEFEAGANALKNGFAAKVADAVSKEPVTISADKDVQIAVKGIEDAYHDLTGRVYDQNSDTMGAMVTAERNLRLEENKTVDTIRMTLSSQLRQSVGNEQASQLIAENSKKYNAIVNDLGQELYGTWNRTTDFTRQLSKDIAGNKISLGAAKKAVEKFAETNGLTKPVMDLTDVQSVRDSLWTWYRQAGNQHFLDYSLAYKDRLWEDCVAPLADAIYQGKPWTPEQMLQDYQMSGLMNNLAKSQQDIENIKALNEAKNLASYTGNAMPLGADATAPLDIGGKPLNDQHAKNLFAKYPDANGNTYVLDATGKVDPVTLKPGQILIQPDKPGETIADLVQKIPEESRNQILAQSTGGKAAASAPLPNGVPAPVVVKNPKNISRISQLEQENIALKVENKALKTDTLTQLPIFDKSPDLQAGKYFGFADMHGAKLVNDSLGHATADGMFEQYGKELADAATQAGYKVARLHGDEFVVVSDKADPEGMAKFLSDFKDRWKNTIVVMKDNSTGEYHVQQGFDIWTGHGADVTEADAGANAAREAYNARLVGDARLNSGGVTTLKPGDPGYEEAIANYEKSHSNVGVPSGGTGVSGNAENIAGGATRPAPQALETMPSPARVHSEQLDNMTAVFDQEVKRVVDNWGKTTKTFGNLPADVESKLADFELEAGRRMTVAKASAMKYADYARDFALHNYAGKTYLDKALGFIYPYQFWYSRSYMNWMSRIIARPEIMIAYQKYHNMVAQAHAGMPDWWKYNISTNDLPGMNNSNPLYFNLEASLNPMNGLTGVDFNDPNKRVNWWTKTIDDLNKAGPTLFTPINWAVAGALYLKGQNDAAQRWAGRLIPQTAFLKSTAYKLGVKTAIPYNELDPFVQFFSGGLDPYERRRVGRALGTMVDQNQTTPEAAMDAAHSQTGPLWEQAVAVSQDQRAVSNLTSMFAGVGLKGRLQSDQQIDQFYTDYFNLWNIKDSISPDQFDESMGKLRSTYPWMDEVLMSRKPDVQRDSALAYETMSRIPPGQKTELAKLVGIDDLMTPFYNSKGDLTSMAPSDKSRFMNGIMDIAAVLKIPDDATAAEYSQATNAYSDMTAAIAAKFGTNITAETNDYYSQPTSAAKSTYVLQHPEVQQAIDFKNQYVLSSPILNKYYGGISTLEQFYTNQMYDTLDKKYPTAAQEWSQYDMLGTKDATAFKKAHPDMVAYNSLKQTLSDNMTRAIAGLGSIIPDTPQAAIRTDTQPFTGRQQEIANSQQAQPATTWPEYQQMLGGPLSQLIVDYFVDGKPLPYAASTQMDYYAQKLGAYDGRELLQEIGTSMFPK